MREVLWWKKVKQARKMITTHKFVFLTCSSSLLILSLITILQTCNANCIPSACGLIPNISSPFRLSHDPHHCGDSKYQLVCENNVTSITLYSHKYLVKAINYHNFTIRVVDASLNNNNLCSFPSSSSSSAAAYKKLFFAALSNPYFFESGNQQITVMSCQHPLHNSSLFTRAPDCDQKDNASLSYIRIGEIRVNEMDYMCTVDTTVATSSIFTTDLNNISLSEIHQSRLHGFDLSWHSFLCRNCKGTFGCTVEPDGLITCGYYRSSLSYWWISIKDALLSDASTGCLMIFLLVVAVVFAGFSIPAKIIIAFGYYWFSLRQWRGHVRSILVVSFEVRFIVGILCTIGFLIYKFRQRRLFMYEEIEGFLQSDNELSPIRYSYSDLKKMTRGFREKLGEGGFGSVYKGKLRSGHYVAVKILGKATTNGQDFMNEIATIGRIHHVNVIKLVGYCAERSKRALIFDFMPNGSLDKYIFNKEKTHSLDWDTKFKIAIGVAQGIEYLHRGCDIQILHFDIKPHNILLDDKFVPKVSDFGLAKICAIEKDSVTLTAARGTIGCVAPELINRSIGVVSYKADVYSFGMLLMEMVGLNKELRGNKDDSSKYFPCWIYEHIKQGREIEIEETEESNGNDEKESRRKILVKKMTIVALWCIRMSPEERPSMNKVLQMLEGDVERLKVPDYPSQSAYMTSENEEESSWATDATQSQSLLHYTNGGSIEIAIA